MYSGVDLSRFETFNSYDSASILKIFRDYQSQFDGSPRRYPEAMRIAGAIFFTENEENIRSCAQKLQVREQTLRAWVDAHGQLPMRRLAIDPLNSTRELALQEQEHPSNSVGDVDGSIMVELPNGCKITARGVKADLLIAKLLQ